MKITFSFLILSFVSLIFAACEKTESNHAKHERLGIRADDCNDCPVDDCCCYVELDGSTSAVLTFCGTTNPDISSTVCGPIAMQDPCPDVSGYYWNTTLNSFSNPNEFFCVAKQSSIMIGVGNAPTNLTLTCQYGQISSQVLNLSLSANEKLFFTADANCGLSTCHPE
jgi:hypothetical protein